MVEDDLFRGCGVEISLKSKDDFLIVCETLTRIGIISISKKTIYQSCHLLHKRGRYSILHFKELFKLDGKPSSLEENDIARRNTIVNMLAEWKLINIIDLEKCKAPIANPGEVRVISHGDKKNWDLVSKYQIGVKK